MIGRLAAGLIYTGALSRFPEDNQLLKRLVTEECPKEANLGGSFRESQATLRTPNPEHYYKPH